jgi:hypothetical protein
MSIEIGLVSSSFVLRGAEIALLPWIIFIMFGLLIIMPGALLRRWFFYKRRLSSNVITAEYEPPLGLNPAEVGYLFDGKLRELEVGATIISLIQRGFLHIKKVNNKKKIFTGPRVDSNLKVYEKKLIEEADKSEGIFASELLSRFTSLKAGNYTIPVISREMIFTQLVHSDLQRHQYVRGSFVYRFLYSTFKIYLLFVALVIYMPLSAVWFFGAVENGATDFSTLGTLLLIGFMVSVFLFVPFYVACMVMNYFRGRVVGREWIITPKLKRLWPQIVGYRQYIKMVENEKLEFSSKSLKSVSKNKSLPYAVALGFVKNWRDIIS